MPGWFIRWSIIAVFAWLASLSGTMVIETTLLTNGLVLPLWTLAVNLWWGMRLIGPWVWLTRRGKPVLGFAITTTMLAALVAGLSLHIAHLRDTIVPQKAGETTCAAISTRSCTARALIACTPEHRRSQDHRRARRTPVTPMAMPVWPP